jgi:hypothetical protein
VSDYTPPMTPREMELTSSLAKARARVAELENLLAGVQRTLEHSIARHQPVAPPPFQALPCELCVERLDEVKAALASDGSPVLEALRVTRKSLKSALATYGKDGYSTSVGGPDPKPLRKALAAIEQVLP